MELLKIEYMKKINIITFLLIGIFSKTLAQETTMDYRRSSIYSIMINHTEQQFASEIKEAYLQIPVPDKFNDHNKCKSY